jgi:single-stranded DNA-binding protein
MIDACFTGRLGRDAELRHVKNGSLPMLAFSAAVQDGQAADDAPAIWVRVVVFRRRSRSAVSEVAEGHQGLRRRAPHRRAVAAGRRPPRRTLT